MELELLDDTDDEDDELAELGDEDDDELLEDWLLELLVALDVLIELLELEL